MPEFVFHLLPFCYLAFTAYLIWSEVKGLLANKPKKDALIDYAIAVILVCISVYQLYAIKCDLTNYLTYIHLLVILAALSFGTLVSIRYNESKKIIEE